MQITKAQFIDALRINLGSFAKTAEYIRDTYHLETYTRQAVSDRAKKLPPEILKEIEEEGIEKGEDALRYCLDQKIDYAVKLRAATFLLSTKGRHLGYGEKVDIIPPSEPIRIVVVSSNPEKDG